MLTSKEESEKQRLAQYLSMVQEFYKSLVIILASLLNIFCKISFDLRHPTITVPGKWLGISICEWPNSNFEFAIENIGFSAIKKDFSEIASIVDHCAPQNFRKLVNEIERRIELKKNQFTHSFPLEKLYRYFFLLSSMLPSFFIQQLKITALIFNSLFALISIFLLFIAIFSWFSPPSTGIFPSPVSDHQYSLAVFFIFVTSISIFLLSVLGIVSLVLCSSFCMFLCIVILLIEISVQFILSAFALSNQHKIHATIISQWRELPNESCSGSNSACTNYLQLLNDVERIIFISLLIFFSLQVLLLVINCCYCNYLSEKEQYETAEKDDADGNEP